MRNATVLVVRLKGVATEAIKNIVLAGIGKLIIVDDEFVAETDLGCGFFFSEASVGQLVSNYAHSAWDCLTWVGNASELRPLNPKYKA
jgi:ubiquitin-like 1-activating enzyme E1 A